MLWGALADDLTGGLELAAAMASEGLDTRFVTDPRRVGDTDAAHAVVLARKTRVAPPDEAVRAFDEGAAALRDAGARRLFFKYCATFDSTDRGNIGPCADRLLDRTGAAFTAYCPSFPEYGRSVFQGHLFAGDRLISESPKRFDPLTPMTDPDLVRVLQRQTPRRVGLIPHEVVRAGPRAVADRAAALAADDTPHAIVDAICDADLDTIARASADWPLMTGNTTVAARFPACWRASGALGGDGRPVGLPAVRGPAVVLAGSCADRTIAQLRRFETRHPVLRLDLESIDDEAAAIDALAGRAQRAMREGPVAIATSAPPEVVRRVQQRHGVDGAAALGERMLAELAQRLWDAGARRFVVAGGETSGAVLGRLGVSRLTVGPFAVPWMPIALWDDGPPAAFCLKSGKLADDDAFEAALARMERGR
jgi:uncharacterized protein YgbK (DUF1537 family)